MHTDDKQDGAYADTKRFPTVEQQIRKIEERMQALYAGEIAIPADVVDEVLRAGGNQKESMLRIIYNFMLPQTEEEYTEFLGIKVVCHNIPIRPGRNLAIICESAAINHRQKRMGYNAAQELYRRVQESLAKRRLEAEDDDY